MQYAKRAVMFLKHNKGIARLAMFHWCKRWTLRCGAVNVAGRRLPRRLNS